MAAGFRARRLARWPAEAGKRRASRWNIVRRRFAERVGAGAETLARSGWREPQAPARNASRRPSHAATAAPPGTICSGAYGRSALAPSSLSALPLPLRIDIISPRLAHRRTCSLPLCIGLREAEKSVKSSCGTVPSARTQVHTRPAPRAASTRETPGRILNLPTAEAGSLRRDLGHPSPNRAYAFHPPHPPRGAIRSHRRPSLSIASIRPPLR